jgi:hypothetical protein
LVGEGPPGLLEGAEPALPGGGVEGDVPPAPGLLVPPVAPGLDGEPGAGVVEAAPPGAILLSLVADAEGFAPPGAVAALSLRSQPESANAPTINNR